MSSTPLADARHRRPRVGLDENFIDPALTDWQHAYYGANFDGW
jgi:hypothetical protein